MSIPKIIHQMWIGDRTPPEQEMYSWKKSNPAWKYILWNEEKLSQHFPNGLLNQEQYENMPELNGKCDIAKYEILHKFGGVFFDADSICLRPLDDELLDNDSFSCYENESLRGGLIASGFLGTTKKNDLMNELSKRIHKLNVKKKWWESKTSAWKKVGPRFFTSVVNDLNYTDLKIYPSYYFIPKHYTGKQYTGPFKPYCDHLWGSTPKSGYEYS